MSQLSADEIARKHFPIGGIPPEDFNSPAAPPPAASLKHARALAALDAIHQTQQEAPRDRYAELAAEMRARGLPRPVSRPSIWHYLIGALLLIGMLTGWTLLDAGGLDNFLRRWERADALERWGVPIFWLAFAALVAAYKLGYRNAEKWHQVGDHSPAQVKFREERHLRESE